MLPTDLQTLYEDADVIALNKPEGICSIPERQDKKNDLLSILSVKWGLRPYVVHRLDRDVSGIILFAKNAAAHASLNDQFSGRTVKKTYTALVHGKVDADTGKIQKPIRKFGSGRMGIDAKGGKQATTLFTVKRRFARTSLLDVHPISGRRHQIRVHLYSAGHPVVGDHLYGEQKLQKQFPRLMLHASFIEFKRPSGETLKIECALPESFSAVLKDLPQ